MVIFLKIALSRAHLNEGLSVYYSSKYRIYGFMEPLHGLIKNFEGMRGGGGGDVEEVKKVKDKKGKHVIISGN